MSNKKQPQWKIDQERNLLRDAVRSMVDHFGSSHHQWTDATIRATHSARTLRLLGVDPFSRPEISDEKMIYISGPMTGIEHFNFPAFELAEKALTDQGHSVLSAHRIVQTSTEWADMMRRDVIEMMLHCDSIALLPRWQQSRGSQIEVAVARAFNFRVFNINSDFSLTRIML